MDLDDFMRNIVIKYESLAESGTQNPKKMSISLLSLAIFNNLRSHSLNNQPLKKGTKPTMAVTKLLTIVAAHEKKSLRHLVNIGRKKRMGALGTGENGMNTGPQHTIQFFF